VSAAGASVVAAGAIVSAAGAGVGAGVSTAGVSAAGVSLESEQEAKNPKAIAKIESFTKFFIF